MCHVPEMSTRNRDSSDLSQQVGRAPLYDLIKSYITAAGRSSWSTHVIRRRLPCKALSTVIAPIWQMVRNYTWFDEVLGDKFPVASQDRRRCAAISASEQMPGVLLNHQLREQSLREQHLLRAELKDVHYIFYLLIFCCTGATPGLGSLWEQPALVVNLSGPC